MKDILARIVAHLIISLVLALIWRPAYNWHFAHELGWPQATFYQVFMVFFVIRPLPPEK